LDRLAIARFIVKLDREILNVDAISGDGLRRSGVVCGGIGTISTQGKRNACRGGSRDEGTKSTNETRFANVLLANNEEFHAIARRTALIEREKELADGAHPLIDDLAWWFANDGRIKEKVSIEILEMLEAQWEFCDGIGKEIEMSEGRELAKGLWKGLELVLVEKKFCE